MLQRKKYSEVLDEWFLYQKRYVRESTYSTYFHHIESHIKPFFKGKRIGRITHVLNRRFNTPHNRKLY